jgi:hypothetical protein
LHKIKRISDNNNDISSNIKDHISLSLRDAIYRSTIEINDSNSKLKPLVLVTGSAFIMGEVRAELGIIEPLDGDIFLEASNNN